MAQGEEKKRLLWRIFLLYFLVHTAGSLMLLAMDILPSSGFFWLQNIRGKSACA